MAHHIGDFEVSSTWAAICNELCFRVALFPDTSSRRGDAAAVARRRPEDLRSRAHEVRQRVRRRRDQPEPRPVGRPLEEPPLTDRRWYPIYEKMVEYDIPAMIHVSTSCNAVLPHHRRALHQRRHDRLHAADQGDLFKDFPTLRFIIPHGGGAVPYHWGRFRGLAQELKKPLLEGPPAGQRLLRHLRLPPAGHRPADAVIPVENMLFASEMIGAVRGIDPETGHYSTIRSATSTPRDLSDEEKHMIYEGNARRVFPRLDATLKAQGR